MKYFIAYGDFIDPTSGENFVVCRCPEGRIQWSKKLMPALHRLIKTFVPKIRKGDWWVDGETDSIWQTAVASCYDWQPVNEEDGVWVLVPFEERKR